MFTICVLRRASCQRGPTQNQNESINNMIWSRCSKRVNVAKADLLFLFVNEMKWGGTWKKVTYGIIKRKLWSKCYCRSQMQGANITKKYKKRRQVLRQLWKLNKKGNSYITGMLWISFQNTNKMCTKQSPLFPMLMR